MSDPEIPPPTGQDVRAPRLAVIGVVIVVVTLLVAAVAVGVAVMRLGST